MDGLTTVRADRLTKTFELFESPLERVRCRLGLAEPRRLTAVDQVSFDVTPGRPIGIVGENGAGKSTLLRMLAGITRPTAGACEVEGRIGSILELGAGFHTELTGRQNIRLSAALAGLDPLHIAELSEEIIEFGELAAFIDEPVKRYSSGMVVRLAFAIATRSEPDVLIVDEALSVGDGRFQKKCLDRIRSFMHEGGTLVFSTHALYYMTSICEEAIWLRAGRVAASGAADEVAREYDAYLRREPESGAEAPAPDRPALDQPKITGVRLLGARNDGQPVAVYEPGGSWGVEVTLAAPARDLPMHVGVSVDTSDLREIFACATHRDGLPPVCGRLRARVRLEVPELPLQSGEFQLHAYLLDETGLHVYDHRLLPVAFRVGGGLYSPALIDPPHEWELPA